MPARVAHGVGWLLAEVGEAVAVAARAVRDTFLPPYEIKETLRQLYEVGWRSIPLIAASGLAVGIVLSMHTRRSSALGPKR